MTDWDIYPISPLALMQQSATTGHIDTPRGAMRPGFCRKLTPLKSEGVGDVGCAVHPQPRVRK
jgi:hypothetical protein